MASSNVCACCGKQLIGQKRKYNGEFLCAECYKEKMEQEIRFQEAKGKLYDYIKGLFGLNECPDEVVYTIDKALRDGKKLKGIRNTLWYYYEVMGHPTDNYNYLSKVIREQYENAREFFKEQEEVKKKNAQVDLHNLETVVVKIPAPKKKKKDLGYRMEDL